jgi:rubrerythrin
MAAERVASPSGRKRSAGQTERRPRMATMQSTGTRDVTYDLISVVYHALQGAETMQRYEHDAEQSGDRDAATFFREAMEQNRVLANRVKDLLGQRIEPNGMGLSHTRR